jgi:hypothetical protein
MSAKYSTTSGIKRLGAKMRLDDSDWDDKPAGDFTRVAIMNATSGAKALRELKNPIAILAFAVAWGLHRIIAGSWH